MSGLVALWVVGFFASLYNFGYSLGNESTFGVVLWAIVALYLGALVVVELIA